MECIISKLLPDDTDKLKQLLLVYNGVFAWQDFVLPSDAYLQKMLNNPQHLVFVALLNNTVIGGFTAYILPEFETENSLVYIYDLAVSTTYQRQGIGQQLIQGIRSYCSHQTSLIELFVQADEKDDYAVDFYRKTGGSEMKVRQLSYFLNL